MTKEASFEEMHISEGTFCGVAHAILRSFSPVDHSSRYFFLIFPHKHRHQSASNEYPQHMFCVE